MPMAPFRRNDPANRLLPGFQRLHRTKYTGSRIVVKQNLILFFLALRLPAMLEIDTGSPLFFGEVSKLHP